MKKMNSIFASREKTFVGIYIMISRPIYDIRAFFYDMIWTHRCHKRVRKYDSYKELKRILSQLKKDHVGSTFHFMLFNYNDCGELLDELVTFTTELHGGKKIITPSGKYRYKDGDCWLPDGDMPKSERKALYYSVQLIEESNFQEDSFDFDKGIFWIRHPMISFAELVAQIDESNKSLD